MGVARYPIDRISHKDLISKMPMQLKWSVGYDSKCDVRGDG
jgi:hypothetical protein